MTDTPKRDDWEQTTADKRYMAEHSKWDIAALADAALAEADERIAELEAENKFPLTVLAACLASIEDGTPVRPDEDLAELPAWWARLVDAVQERAEQAEATIEELRRHRIPLGNATETRPAYVPMEEYRKFTFGVSHHTDAGRITEKADAAIAAIEAEYKRYREYAAPIITREDELKATIERLKWMVKNVCRHDWAGTGSLDICMACGLTRSYDGELLWDEWLADLERRWAERGE